MYRDGSRELQVLNLNKDKDEKSANGASVTQAEGEKCPGMLKCYFYCLECGGRLIFTEGCSQCSDCGMSICQM